MWLSSLFVVGTASGTTSTGVLRIGSTLAVAGGVLRTRVGEGLITTGAGAAAAACGTGLATMAGGAAGAASTGCVPSIARFWSNTEIWSAMVFSTATCVIKGMRRW